MISSVVESSSPQFHALKSNRSDSVHNVSSKENSIENRLISTITIKSEPSNGHGDLSFESQHSSGDDSGASDRKFRRKNSRPQKVTSGISMHSEQQHQLGGNPSQHQMQHLYPSHQHQQIMLALPQVDTVGAAAVASSSLGLCETCGSPLASIRNSRPGRPPGECELIVLCVDCTCDRISLLLEESDSCERTPPAAESTPAPTEAVADGGSSTSAAYVCRLCQQPRVFATSTEYLEHYVCEHEHPIKLEADSPPLSAEADDHEADAAASEAHRCSHCGLGLRSEDDVEQHERFHLECEFDTARLRCYYCCKEFQELDALNAHQRAHSTERPHHCSVCDKAFSFACTLQRHMLVHQAFHSTYTCHYCDQTFSDAGQLDRHFDICERNMDDAAGMLADGEGSKPGAPNRFLPYSHTCSTCGKSFRLAWRYKLHMRAACNTADKYNADSDRTCSICKKMFANPMNLHRHELIHAGIRNYQCKLCGKAFVQKTQLATHMNIHNGIKPFQCEVCNKNFTDRSTFHKHKKIHGKPKAFPCAVCGKVFNQAGYLKLHAKVHGVAEGGGVGTSQQHDQQQQIIQQQPVPPMTYCDLDEIKMPI